MGVKPAVSASWEGRFKVTSRRAVVWHSAAAKSGTSRCGITLVNHDPGPSTTQSAASTAATASGQAGGAGGRSETLATRPGVVATATCPVTVASAKGSPVS